MRDFLCIVTDKFIKNRDYAIYEIRATDSFFASIKAVENFEGEQKYQPKLRNAKNWHVEVVEI